MNAIFCEDEATGRILGWAAGGLAASLLAIGASGLGAECDADSSSLAAAKDALRNAWGEICQGPHSGLPAHGEPKVILAEGKLSVRFPVRRGADLSAVVVELVCRLTGGGGDQLAGVRDGEMRVKVAECGVARVLHFEQIGEKREASGDEDAGDEDAGGIYAKLFVPTYGTDLPEVEFQKSGALSTEDVNLITTVLRTANTIRNDTGLSRDAVGVEGRFRRKSWAPFEEMESMLNELLGEAFGGVDGRPRFGFEFEARRFPEERLPWQSYPEEDGDEEQEVAEGRRRVTVERVPDNKEQIVQQLERMGAKVYRANPQNKIEWGLLAGYDDQKRRIEDGLLLPLLHPDVYDDVAKATRKHFATNRPRGVLFEGPPGTGKTTSARVIASQAAVPLVYIPLEAVVSKWYGESERLLAQAFKAADSLGGSIIFLDEIETLAVSRSQDTNEATRRLLGVLLREMDGFDTAKRTVVIAATNRKQDVDPALLSRFDATIRFDLPDEPCRALIIQQYAKHLGEEDVATLARASEGMSGRDLRDICEQAERNWASRIVREEVGRGQLPRLEEYQDACEQRQRSME